MPNKILVLISALLMTSSAYAQVGAGYSCSLATWVAAFTASHPNCSNWSYDYPSGGGSASISTANPIGCPNITGPTTDCYATLYCKDHSGITDQCFRIDQTGAANYPQTSPVAATCISSGFNHVVQTGKDVCRKPAVSTGGLNGVSPGAIKMGVSPGAVDGVPSTGVNP